MDLNHLPTPKSPPDEFYIAALALLVGQERQFCNRTLTEFIGTEAFADAVTDPQAVLVNVAFMAGFGPTTTPEQAADILKNKLSHADDSEKLRAITVTVMVFAILLATLKIATTWRSLGRFRLDDGLMALGLVFNIAISVLVLISPQDVRQIWDIDFNAIQAGLARVVLLLTFSLLGHLFTQLALLQMYRNPFPERLTFHRVAIAVGIMSTIGTIILFVFNRIYSKADGLDFNLINHGYHVGNAASVFYIVTDFIILALPTSMVWKLQMPLRTKLAVIFMFALGACAGIFSILRIKAFNKEARNPNFSGNAFNFGCYTTFEQYLGLICACLPALRAIFRSQAERVKSVLGGSQGSTLVSVGSRDRRIMAQPEIKVVPTDYANVVVRARNNLGILENNRSSMRNSSVPPSPGFKSPRSPPRRPPKPCNFPIPCVPPVSPSSCGHLARNRSFKSYKCRESFSNPGMVKSSTLISRSSRDVIIGLDVGFGDDLEQGVPYCFDCGHHIRADSLSTLESAEREAERAAVYTETEAVAPRLMAPAPAVQRHSIRSA